MTSTATELYVNVSIGLFVGDGRGLSPSSNSAVSFSVGRDRTADRLDDMVSLLRGVAGAVEANRDRVVAALGSAEEGRGDLRRQLEAIGIDGGARPGGKEEAAKLMGLALALVAMPNDPTD